MSKSEKKPYEENKEKRLALTIGGLEKSYGKGIIIWGEKTDFPAIQRISSGSFGLDYALNGGYAQGRLIELYGPFSSGKTTLALHIIAEYQKKGGTCLFVDVEHALDIHYAASLGVNINDLLLTQPDCGEDALNIVETFIRSDTTGLIVVDSVAALTPKAEIEGDIGDSRPGLQARLMSQALRVIAGPAKKHNVTIVFINQMRLKIGVFFGSPETTTSGEALKYYASQRLEIRRTGNIKEGDEVVGISTKVKIVKNKVGPPFRQAEFNILFGKGIDWAQDLATIGLNKGIFTRSGAWYFYGEQKLGQGINSVIEALKQDSEFAQIVRDKVIQTYNLPSDIVSNDQAILMPEEL
jgi:recombination protein RecA